ncbi:MAG TPA: HyaD/HybD family hydrogenase maturation endopeptidase [Gemmatimonadales bacterium]|jgi:hydrogenase maturation protease
MTKKPDSVSTLVLGLGNPLMGDDGIGLAILNRLRAEWEFEGVELVDGGTWGMQLLPMIEDADRLVLLDAIRTGAPPGTVTELQRDELPRYLSHKLSPHQIDLREVLALAELRGRLPQYTVAIGAEPERVELSLALSPTVEGNLDEVIRTVVDRLARWGCPARSRTVTVDA